MNLASWSIEFYRPLCVTIGAKLKLLRVRSSVWDGWAAGEDGGVKFGLGQAVPSCRREIGRKGYSTGQLLALGKEAGQTAGSPEDSVPRSSKPLCPPPSLPPSSLPLGILIISLRNRWAGRVGRRGG